MTWIKGPMHRFLCDYVPTGDYEGRAVCSAGEGGRVAEFRSAGLISVLADQLRAHGWTIAIKSRTVGLGRAYEVVKALTGTAERVHLCPVHRPLGVMEGAELAQRKSSG